MTFVYDAEGRFLDRLNPDSVIAQRIETEYWEEKCRALVAEHARRTQSAFAAGILNGWAHERARFWQVVPKEMLTRLEAPLAREPAVRVSAAE